MRDFSNVEGLGVQGVVGGPEGVTHAVLVGRPRLLAEWSQPLPPELAERLHYQGTAAIRADIARAEGWLNNLRNLKARFLQIAQGGAAAEGTAWISRPGRMRFEYDPPEPLLLVAAHGQFFYYDKAMKQATTLPLSATPPSTTTTTRSLFMAVVSR